MNEKLRKTQILKRNLFIIFIIYKAFYINKYLKFSVAAIGWL